MTHPCLATLVLMVTLAPIVACTDSAGPSSAAVSGLYVLESVSGRGPATGSATLSRSGEAERRVRYTLPTGGQSPEYVARGTFRLHADGTIDLQLREDDGHSTYIWRPIASLSAGVLRLQHPDPADGPDIVELYRRR